MCFSGYPKLLKRSISANIGACNIGVEMNSLLERGERILVEFQSIQGLTFHYRKSNMVWFQVKSLLKRFQSIVVALKLEESHPLFLVGLKIVCIKTKRLLKGL